MIENIDDFSRIEADIWRLKTQSDLTKLEQMIISFEQLTLPGSVQHWQYYYCAYGYMSLYQLGLNPKENIEKAVAVLKQAHGNQDKSEEFYAMTASCHGLLAANSKDILKKAKAGIASDDSFKIALDINPDNPRTCLLKGISIMNKPRIVGGSKKKALAILRKSVTLFESSAHSQDIPSWRKLDALYWLSYLSLYFNQFREADHYIDQALAIASDFSWANNLKQKIEKKWRN